MSGKVTKSRVLSRYRQAFRFSYQHEFASRTQMTILETKCNETSGTIDDSRRFHSQDTAIDNASFILTVTGARRGTTFLPAKFEKPGSRAIQHE